MSSRPAVLIVPPHLGPIAPFLDGAYDVHRLWEGPPVEAEALIEAVVVAGEFPLDPALIDRLPKLRHVACFTAGYDGIDPAWCRARGLEVTHAPGVNHEDVADHAIGLILAAHRRIASGDADVRAGRWTPQSKTITRSLGGLRMGIVGLGAIGEAVARRGEAMRMIPSWWGPRPKDAAWPRAESLADLAKASDVLVIACRADETNRGLISAEVIAALGPDGLLVNVARGQVVDEDALIAALKSGRLAGAALDVFESEPTDAARWADVPNTVLTPHTGGATTQAVQGMLVLLLQNLDAVLNCRPPVTPAP